MSAANVTAAPCWRWRPGMLLFRVSGSSGSRHTVRLTEHYMEPLDGLDWRPDLTDPATLGCLLKLVREAWECPGTHCDYSRSITVGDSPWWVWVIGEHERWMCVARAPTEGEALVAALLAAPVRS